MCWAKECKVNKRRLTTLLKVGLSVLILYVLFSRVDLLSFWETVSSVSPQVVAFGVLAFFLTQCVTTVRWSILLGCDVEVPYRNIFSIYFVGMFFNNFLPTLVGGDLVKGYYLYKKTGRGDVSFASVLMDRYTGFTALITITTVALVIGYGSLSAIGGEGLVWAFVVFIGAFVGGSLFMWVNTLHGWLVGLLLKIHFLSLNKKIDTFYKVLMGYKNHGPRLFKAYLLSFLVQGGVILGYIIVGSGMGMEVHPGYYFLFIPLATAVSMAPISLSGLGVREGAFVFLFTKAGATVEQALGLSLLWFAIMVFVSLIGGVEYLRMGGGKEFGRSFKQGEDGPDAAANQANQDNTASHDDQASQAVPLSKGR